MYGYLFFTVNAFPKRSFKSSKWRSNMFEFKVMCSTKSSSSFSLKLTIFLIARQSPVAVQYQKSNNRSEDEILNIFSLTKWSQKQHGWRERTKKQCRCFFHVIKLAARSGWGWLTFWPLLFSCKYIPGLNISESFRTYNQLSLKFLSDHKNSFSYSQYTSDKNTCLPNKLDSINGIQTRRYVVFGLRLHYIRLSTRNST